MSTLRIFVLALMACILFVKADAQETLLSAIRNFTVANGYYSFDIYAAGEIPIGTGNLIINTNRGGLSPVGMRLTNINPTLSGPADHSGDYDPMRIDTIAGAANAGKIVVTILFTGNNSGAGATLANQAQGTRICTVNLPVSNRAIAADFMWDLSNSGLTDSRNKPVVNSFTGSCAGSMGTTVLHEVAPKVFALYQNYPNPFNPESVIKFSVEKSGRATLNVYSILGQKVATLFDGIAEAGQYYQVRLAGQNLASGTYIYRLQSGQQSDVKKLVLLK